MAGQLGGDHNSRAAQVAARERERLVVQFYIRGLTLAEIATQVGLFDASAAAKALKRAIKRIPPKDVEELRKLQSERLQDARRRIFGELAGRKQKVPDPGRPGELREIDVRPDAGEVSTLVGRLIDLEKHEADLYGLYAPKKTDIRAAVSGMMTHAALSDDELDTQLARLTPDEQQEFMRLLAKMQGRWVEPAAVIEDQGDAAVETTATTVTTVTSDEGSENG